MAFPPWLCRPPRWTLQTGRGGGAGALSWDVHSLGWCLHSTPDWGVFEWEECLPPQLRGWKSKAKLLAGGRPLEALRHHLSLSPGVWRWPAVLACPCLAAARHPAAIFPRPSPCVSVPQSPRLKAPSQGIRTRPNPVGVILTWLHIRRRCFQIRSRSQGPGLGQNRSVGGWACGHTSAHRNSSCRTRPASHPVFSLSPSLVSPAFHVFILRIVQF